MVTAPSDLLRDVYGWGTPAYDATALVVNLGAVLQHIAVDVRRRELGALPLMRLHGGSPPAHPPMTQLFLPLVGSDVAGSSEAGLTVFGLPPTAAGGADGGLGVAPYARGTAELRVPLTAGSPWASPPAATSGTGIALLLRVGRRPRPADGPQHREPGQRGRGRQHERRPHPRRPRRVGAGDGPRRGRRLPHGAVVRGDPDHRRVW